MNEKKAFEIVARHLMEVPIFMGEYDAANGNRSFMNGVCFVMEYITYFASDEIGDEFGRIFLENLQKSVDKAKSMEYNNDVKKEV